MNTTSLNTTRLSHATMLQAVREIGATRPSSTAETTRTDYAGQELKALEVVVEVEKRRVLNVLRVLPYRTRLGKDGRPHKDEARKQMARAFSGNPTTIDEQIARLQADAELFLGTYGRPVGGRR
jgi:hypothetical protein